MRSFFFVAAAMLALVSPVVGQQQQTIEQRVGAQLGALMLQNTNLQIQVEQLQLALKSAQDRVKALENKYEPQERK